MLTKVAYCYTVSILSQVLHHCRHLGSILTPDLPAEPAPNVSLEISLNGNGDDFLSCRK